MAKPVRTLPLAVHFLLALSSSSAFAGIHTWDVSEVFSNADGTIQFVELKEAAGGPSETGVSNSTITSNAKSFSWTVVGGATQVGNTANRFYLIATPGFAALPGAPTPDAIITADKLPFFFNPAGDSVDFSTWDTCTFSVPIPTDGVGSLDCGVGPAPNSPQATNSPTNYAGISAPVNASLLVLDQIDDFQGGTVANWAGGSTPSNQPNGQTGAGDLFLRITSTAGPLGTFNLDQWAGDYLAEEIDQIEVDARNSSGSDPLSLRIVLFTPGCDQGGAACTAWTSTNAVALAANDTWTPVTFSLAEADLTRVLGTDSYAASLANVERLLIRHDDGAPSTPGPTPIPVTATLGIDNITAVPEPPGPLGLAAGAALLAAAHRRRRRHRG